MGIWGWGLSFRVQGLGFGFGFGGPGCWVLATVHMVDSVPGVLFVVGNVYQLAGARHWVLFGVCGSGYILGFRIQYGVQDTVWGSGFSSSG